MKILMMGPQGCGKGTTGGMLAEYLNIPMISTGQLLRDIPENSPWYKTIHAQMEQGVLVDQEKVAELLKENLSDQKYANGFVLDGWFRSLENVRLFEPEIDIAILLTISPETTVKRLGSRRTCSKCGQIYNIITIPPKIEGVCDKCGGKLTQREDDTEEAILKRLSIYNEETKEVIEYLRRKNLLIEINAEGTPAEVFEIVKSRLNLTAKLV